MTSTTNHDSHTTHCHYCDTCICDKPAGSFCCDACYPMVRARVLSPRH